MSTRRDFPPHTIIVPYFDPQAPWTVYEDGHAVPQFGELRLTPDEYAAWRQDGRLSDDALAQLPAHVRPKFRSAPPGPPARP